MFTSRYCMKMLYNAWQSYVLKCEHEKGSFELFLERELVEFRVSEWS
jgi:hypothetical protein